MGQSSAYAEAAEPRYRQIAKALQSDVVGGLAPGQRIPVERLLCDRFGASRATVRRAIDELVKDGVIERAEGRGWQVTDRSVGEPPNALLSFTELARSRSLHSSSQCLRADVRPADLDEADQLWIAPGSHLLDLERLRFLDDNAIALHHVRLPLIRMPEIETWDFETHSIYEVLQGHYGIVPTRSECVVEARPATPRHARMLGLRQGEPVLTFGQRSFDQTGQPFELSRMDYRWDRYRFQASLVRGVDGNGEARLLAP